ncbi:MAG TPA: rod shape-determining protein MreD [Anaerohalosphaeraceae bacterium]|jgi:rod shape-determining protein MreD|nr:rod shape-determining protein MreD [Anaerohalosphaeraceae bacterium]
MRWFLFILIILTAAILEAGNLLNLIAFGQGQIRPSVLIILLVYFSLRAAPEQAIIASFAIGLTADLAGPVMGPNTVCLGLAGSLLAQTQGFLSVRRPAFQALIVFLTALLSITASHWLAVLKTSSANLAFSIQISNALYSAAAAPVLWPMLNFLWKFLCPPVPGRTPGTRISHV